MSELRFLLGVLLGMSAVNTVMLAKIWLRLKQDKDEPD